MTLSIFAQAQNNVVANGFTLSFIQESTVGSVEQVATNVLRVKNGNARRMVFTLDVSSPAGWKTLADRSKVYNVAAGDSLFIPVRIVPQKNAEGNVNYFINASAVSTQNIPLASTPWSLEITKLSQWRANVLDKVAYFPTEGDTTRFKVNLTNTGNSYEDVNILFTTPAKIKILDVLGNPLAENAMTMRLEVGVDTTLTFFAKLGKESTKNDFFSAKSVTAEEVEEGVYKVQVQVRDNSGSGSTAGGRVDLFQLSNEKKVENENGNSTIPLTVDFNSYNVLSQFTNFSLDLYGETNLAANKNLRYYYQTIISSSVFTGTQFLSSYRFLQYTTPDYQVAVGNIGDNMEVLLNGAGIKGSYKYKNFRVGAIYVTRQQNGNLQNDNTDIGLRMAYNGAKKLSLETEMVRRNDEFNDIGGNLVTANGTYRFQSSHILRVSAGYSTEQHTQSTNPFTTSGYGFGIKYSATYFGISMASQIRWNSANYLSQYRGTTTINLNLRYPFKLGQYFGLKADINERQAEIYSKGRLFPDNKFKRNIYEFQYGWTSDAGTFVLYPRIHDDEVLGLRTFTTGGGVLFSTNRKSDFRVYSRFYTGFTKALDYNIKPYLVARWENTVRYKNLNVTARYYYGPFNVLDNLRILEDGINPQSVFFSAYANLNFKKARLSVRPTFNLSYESVLARTRSNFSPQLTYYSKNDFQFTITGELFNIDQGESPLPSLNALGDGVFNTFSQSNFLLRIGVKKVFNIKRPGSKSHNLEVVVFKDLNGNNVRDVGEDFVQDAIITVKDISLMTNSEGVVIFKDLPRAEYLVKSDVLSNIEGWFKGDGQKVILDGDRTVFVPLKRGVQVKGNIILQQAQYSALGQGGMNLCGIRVTMTDNDGNVYSGLSGQNGEFNLYVPFGLYTIRVNEQAVDEQFQFAQSSYTLNVNNVNVNYQVTFYLIEKSRALNIKKFDNK
uniref:COG1470 family protein n=1 Tax=Roseivirga sp. TaxID=1964215 RepID=UPI004047637F